MSWREWLGFKPRIADLATRLLRAANSQGRAVWTHDTNNNALRSSDGASLNLENIFREYANSVPAGRKALFEKYVSFFSIHEREIPKLWTLAAKGIFPAVRSKYDYLTVEIDNRADPSKVKQTVIWPFVGDLHIRLLYDFGSNMAHVGGEQLDMWGQTEAEVRKCAINNLKALRRPRWQQLPNGIYRVVSDVAYEESWLLVETVIAQLPFAQFAVLMPTNRGVLLAADGRSETALSAMLHEAISSLQNNPWPMSATMLRCDNGVWGEFKASGIVSKRAQAVATFNIAGTYKDQQDALQKHFDRSGEDVFVAPIDLRQRGDDVAGIYSWCSWTSNVRALLPKTDEIIFGNGDPTTQLDLVMVSWEKAAEICGHYLQATDEIPVRYLVTGFPNVDEWLRLKAVGEPVT